MDDTLSAHPALQGISVVSRKKGDIEAAIAEKLGALGIVAVVLTPRLSDVNGNLPAPQFTVQAQIHCVEIPTTNATGIDAHTLAELVLRIFHLRQFADSAGQVSDFVATSIEPQDGAGGSNFVIVNLTATAGLDPID